MSSKPKPNAKANKLTPDSASAADLNTNVKKSSKGSVDIHIESPEDLERKKIKTKKGQE